MHRISLAALSPYYRTLQTLGICPEQHIVKDSSHPGHLLLSLLPSGRRYRPIKSSTDIFTNSFIQEPFSPWTKRCFALFTVLTSILVDCAIISVFRAALYCLTCIIHIFYMDLIMYSGLCVCGYHIVAPLCSLWNFIAFRCYDNKSLSVSYGENYRNI